MPGDVAHLSSEGQASCFNQYRLPQCWRPYVAFGRPVRGSVIGLATDEPVRLAVTVVPVCWISAADLMQEAR
eukprot:11208101-Lingulodinium_polyedra.AAC.1